MDNEEQNVQTSSGHLHSHDSLPSSYDMYAPKLESSISVDLDHMKQYLDKPGSSPSDVKKATDVYRNLQNIYKDMYRNVKKSDSFYNEFMGIVPSKSDASLQNSDSDGLLHDPSEIASSKIQGELDEIKSMLAEVNSRKEQLSKTQQTTSKGQDTHTDFNEGKDQDTHVDFNDVLDSGNQLVDEESCTECLDRRKSIIQRITEADDFVCQTIIIQTIRQYPPISDAYKLDFQHLAEPSSDQIEQQANSVPFQSEQEFQPDISHHAFFNENAQESLEKLQQATMKRPIVPVQPRRILAHASKDPEITGLPSAEPLVPGKIYALDSTNQ